MTGVSVKYHYTNPTKYVCVVHKRYYHDIAEKLLTPSVKQESLVHL